MALDLFIKIIDTSNYHVCYLMILITFENAKGVALTNGIDTFQVIGSRFISVNSGGSDSEDDWDSAVGGTFGESGRESDDLG